MSDIENQVGINRQAISDPLEVQHASELLITAPVTYIPRASRAVLDILGGTPVFGRNDAVQGVETISTIGSLGRQAEILRFDSMTGLPTRTIFDNDLLRFMKRAKEGISHGEITATALIIADLDNLKLANDLDKSHRSGDNYIIRAVKSLREAGRPGDSIYRIGGDEFAELVIGVEPDILEDGSLDFEAPMARIIAGRSSKVNTDVNNIGLPAEVHAGVSFGYSICRPNDTPEELIGRADAMLYVAKETNRLALNKELVA